MQRGAKKGTWIIKTREWQHYCEIRFKLKGLRLKTQVAV